MKKVNLSLSLLPLFFNEKIINIKYRISNIKYQISTQYTTQNNKMPITDFPVTEFSSERKDNDNEQEQRQQPFSPHFSKTNNIGGHNNKIINNNNNDNNNDNNTRKRILSSERLNCLRVKCLSSKAKLPIRCSDLAAGYDLYSAANIVVPTKGRAVIPTDLSIGMPSGTYGRVAPRSGLAVKQFIDVGAGVVDADFRGGLTVLLFNFGDKDYQVHEGDRIAQLILERICTPEVVQVEELEDTVRGSKGFGSTGI
ncbi:hypothetical protein Glove_152g99 [Diversispora epigaea]|uniref:Deoxyuridine 5'-triphosphate nucleotidohydrolase n=1 Tax=Diversispora epigaea TaxID=1348612 RepID=A0A397J1S5_9GLOM|nr:hypothetical protein Glove_152g99 [Diversispora epigaea]